MTQTHLFLLSVGPWELIRKLGLEEELLKHTEIKPVEGPGELRLRRLSHPPILTVLPVKAFNYRKSDRPEGVEFHTLYTHGE